MPIPELIAHRGYTKHYPENTVIGIAAALRAGARFVEFDIQLTADGVPVLCHDSDLSRTAGVSTRVLNTELAELADISVGEPTRLGDRFRDARIPTLAEIAALLSDRPQVTAFVEIKTESLDRFGADYVVKKILAILAPNPGQYCLISFNISAVRCARRLGAATIGWVIGRWSKAARAAAVALAPEYLFCNYTKVPRAPDGLWPGPWKWALYEIADPELAVTFGRRGADLIVTYAIGEMLQHPLLKPAPDSS